MSTAPARSSASRLVLGRALVAAAAMLLLLATALPAVPAAAGAAVGTVRGTIIGKHGTPKVDVRYFAADWTYLGRVKAVGGAYSLSLEPGTYYLQLVDRAPTYDVDRYAPTDAKVNVVAATTTVRNVRMQRGAAVGGTVRAGGVVAPGARVVAANTFEQSFETTADSSGAFALGGLPPGKYSLFVYDRTKKWVDKSIFLGKVKRGAFRTVSARLGTRAGSLLVDLYAGSERATAPVFVTAVSVKSGQFWTVKATNGAATFRGLYPGRYRLVAPGYGDFLAQTAPIAGGKVKAGRATFGSFRWTMSGARLAGTVVDSGDGSTGLGGAQVLVFDATGTQVGGTVSGADGRFVVAGQLATQSGLTLRAQPGTTAPYLGQGTHYCKYGAATRGGLAVTSGGVAEVGAVALPRLSNAQQDGQQCWSAAG